MVSGIPSLRRSCRGFLGWGGSTLQTRGPSYPTMPFTVWSRRAAKDVFRVQDGNIRIKIKAFCCQFFFGFIVAHHSIVVYFRTGGSQSEQSDNLDSSCHWCFTDEEVLRVAMVNCPRSNVLALSRTLPPPIARITSIPLSLQILTSSRALSMWRLAWRVPSFKEEKGREGGRKKKGNKGLPLI